MTATVAATRRTMLDQIRSIPALYRAAKRAQPAYLQWLSLNARVTRSLMGSPGINRLLANPTAIGAAATMSEEERSRSGLHALSMQPDARAQRTLPPDLRSHQRVIWSEVQHAHSGPAHIFTLADARVWGADGAIVTRDRRLLGDLSPVIRLRPDAHPMFRRPIVTRPRQVDGRLAVATGPSPDNLSHWLFGVMPRLSLITQFDPRLDGTDWIVAPPARTTFQQECIRRFEIPPEKLIEARAMTFLEAREVVAPSFVSPAYVAPRWFLSDLQQRFDDVTPSGSERIYISRRTAPGRRVLNETAVESMLIARGFKSVRLERLSFVEQVALFKGAEMIVGAHGAGLSHLAFARRDAAVVELFAPSYVNPMYWCLADELGLRYRCCLGESSGNRVERDLVRDDITMEIDLLASTVDDMIAAKASTN
jgi:hypothetical protein